jgi:hypothetical protein
MPSQATVTVHGFHTRTGPVENPQVSLFKATPAAIRRLGGEIIEGTAEDVPREELDDEGRYRRVATGWGALE